MSRYFKSLCVLLCAFFMIQVIPVTTLATNQEIQFLSNTPELSFEVQSNITTSWDNYVNLEYIITNTSDDTIHDWEFIVNIPYQIENIWNASIVESDNQYYRIKNADYNQDILPSDSVTIGMTLSGVDNSSNIEEPSVWLLNSIKTVIPSEALTLDYTEYSDWTDGFNGSFEITNNCEYDIRDWSLEFTSNRNIINVYGASLSQSDTGTYVITNDGYNQNLYSFSSWTITVDGNINDNSDFLFENFIGYGYTSLFNLYDDKNGNNISDYLEYIGVENNLDENEITPVPSPIPSEDITPTQNPLNENSIPSCLYQNQNIEMWVNESMFPSNTGLAEIEFTVQSLEELETIYIHDENNELSFISTEEFIENNKHIYKSLYYLNTETDEYTKTIDVKSQLYTKEETIEFDFSIRIRNNDDIDIYNMDYVTFKLFSYIESNVYASDSLEQRKGRLIDILTQLALIGIVEENSITVVETEYENAIVYKPNNEMKCLVSYGNAEESTNKMNSTTSYASTPKKEFTSNIPDGTKIIYFFGFNDEDERLDKCNLDISAMLWNDNISLKEDEVYVLEHPSLEDYATYLNDPEVSVITSHGTYFDNNYQDSGICTGIVINSKNHDDIDYYNREYSKYGDGVAKCDIDSDYFVLYILPSFITENYVSFNNTAVIMENCSSAGEWADPEFVGPVKLDKDLMYSFFNLGSPLVTGYINPIDAQYARTFSCNIISSLYSSKYKENEEKNYFEAYKYALDQTTSDDIYHGQPCCLIKDMNSISPTPTPTSTPTPIVNENRDCIDVWFICEQTIQFNDSKKDVYVNNVNYVLENMIEEDHIGIGFVNKDGTLYTGYDNPVKQHYTYFMYHLYNDTNNVTDKVTPLTWYLCCQWSLDNPFENKLCFSRPDKYEETYFVYYIDSDTAGYFDERYSAEALEWTDYYNVTLFLVNLGEKPIDSSLLEFAEKTGGGVLSTDCEKMWLQLNTIK